MGTNAKRVNIELSEEVHTGAKVIAALKNSTMQEFIVQAIKEAIEREKKLLDKLREIK